MSNYVITISRQFASLGRSIAQKLSEDLEIEFYDRDIVEATSKRMGQPISVVSTEEEYSDHKFFRRMYPLGMGVANMQDEIFEVEKNLIQDFAAKESCIIVGRCGNYVLKDHPNSLHIYIYASYEDRLDNCVNVLNMDRKIAAKMIKVVDKARVNYSRRYSKEISNVFDGYDLMIDSSKFGVDGTAELIEELIEKRFQ